MFFKKSLIFAYLAVTWFRWLQMLSRSQSVASPKYISLLRELYRVNMHNPVKMGLQNTLRLNELLGNPIGSVPVVHVAGTNGKGSVSLKTAEVLRRSGLRTGLFVSPHISSFRERIQVNGEIMTEGDVIKMLPELLELCNQHKIPATFFELTTILSFMCFGRAKCDVIVLEVGLGGRLDSTNIVSPSLSIITSIQLDHTKILGDTIEKIAMEKAGIMKPRVPVLIGPGCPMDLMKQQAAVVGAPLYTLNSVLQPGGMSYCKPKIDIHTGKTISDDIDDLNVDISRAAITLLQKQGGIFENILTSENAGAVESGLAMRPPCRYQLFKRGNTDVILDIAHNEDAMVALAKKVSAHYKGPIRVVLGMSADKDVTNCIACILDLLSIDNKSAVSRIHCAAAKHPRAMGQAQLQELVFNVARDKGLPAGGAPPVKSTGESIALAAELVEKELNGSSNDRGLVLVCGTAFIMADARAELGLQEPRDGDFLLGDDKDNQENFSSTIIR